MNHVNHANMIRAFIICLICNEKKIHLDVCLLICELKLTALTATLNLIICMHTIKYSILILLNIYKRELFSIPPPSCLFKLTVFLCLFDDLLALLAALRVGQHQPQSDCHERPESPQSVMRGGRYQLLSGKLLLVEHILVLDGQVKTVAACHRISKGLPLQGQLTGTDVHNVHILGTVDWICGEKREGKGRSEINLTGNFDYKVILTLRYTRTIIRRDIFPLSLVPYSTNSHFEWIM